MGAFALPPTFAFGTRGRTAPGYSPPVLPTAQPPATGDTAGGGTGWPSGTPLPRSVDPAGGWSLSGRGGRGDRPRLPGGTPTTPTTPPTLPPATTAYDPYNVNQYNPETWRNLPVLNYAQGGVSEAKFFTLPGGDLKMFLPGGEAVVLPAPNKLNWAMMDRLQREQPDSYALLNSAYKAANMPLDAFMGQLKAAAPIGTAYDESLISTQG